MSGHAREVLAAVFFLLLFVSLALYAAMDMLRCFGRLSRLSGGAWLDRQGPVGRGEG